MANCEIISYSQKLRYKSKDTKVNVRKLFHHMHNHVRVNAGLVYV